MIIAHQQETNQAHRLVGLLFLPTIGYCFAR